MGKGMRGRIRKGIMVCGELAWKRSIRGLEWARDRNAYREMDETERIAGVEYG